MEFLDDGPLVGTLSLLALVDGLSIGTLLIPLFLLIAPGRVRAGRVLLYLATITVFYLGVGALFLLGLVNLVDVAADALASTPGLWIRLVIGGTLLLIGILAGGKKSATVTVDAGASADGTTHGSTTAPAPAPAVEPPGRLVRWRERMLSPASSPRVVMAVAIAAGLIEVATMLPYIVGMTMLAEADLPMPIRYLGLAGYCVVMIVPALALLVARVVAAKAVARPLERFAAWLQRNAAESTAWILAIVGFLIARGAAQELGLFGFGG